MLYFKILYNFMIMEKQLVYEKSDKIVTRKVAGETILVPIKGRLADMQKIFSLNEIGDFIWNMIDGKRSTKEICKEIISRFDVDEKVAEDDLNIFIRDLVKEGLIRLVE